MGYKTEHERERDSRRREESEHEMTRRERRGEMPVPAQRATDREHRDEFGRVRGGSRLTAWDAMGWDGRIHRQGDDGNETYSPFILDNLGSGRGWDGGRRGEGDLGERDGSRR